MSEALGIRCHICDRDVATFREVACLQCSERMRQVIARMIEAIETNGFAGEVQRFRAAREATAVLKGFEQ